MGTGMRQRVLAHQHRELREVLLGHAIFVHVTRRDQAVVSGNGRPQRHLVIGVADLGQRLDRGVAALPGETVFAADDKHMLGDAGIDQMMRQHGHRKPGGAADLHGMGVGWADAEMLGEHGREHDVRRDRRVAAENTVDAGSFQSGVGKRKLGRLAHEVERGRAFVFAVEREANTGDEAHDGMTFFNTTSASPAPSRQ